MNKSRFDGLRGWFFLGGRHQSHRLHGFSRAVRCRLVVNRVLVFTIVRQFVQGVDVFGAEGLEAL